MPDINPEILKWARETAGLTLEAAAKGLALSDSKKRTGAEKLTAIEHGDDPVTRQLLTKMASRYHRPLLVFYLKQPPTKGDRGSDFRTIPGAQQPTFDAGVDTLIRDIRARQDLVRALLIEEDAPNLGFVGSAPNKVPSEALATQITEFIGFELGEFRRQNTAEKAFAYLRRLIEDRGVFVVLAGNLGSWHSNIPVEVFRGYAIADTIAPFILINDQDSKKAWSFTALHELAHIFIGATGLSGGSVEQQVERLCNDVAGRILLPEDDLGALPSILDLEFVAAVAAINQFAQQRNISQSMVAYKLLRTGRINQEQWRQFSEHFKLEFLQLKANKEKAEGDGPSYYVVRRHRLGNALLSIMRRCLADGTITQTKAGIVLGVKPRTVSSLLDTTLAQGA